MPTFTLLGATSPAAIPPPAVHGCGRNNSQTRVQNVICQVILEAWHSSNLPVSDLATTAIYTVFVQTKLLFDQLKTMVKQVVTNTWTNPIWTGVWVNPGLRGEKSATNRLSQDTATA
jgi:hypothetical protein